ncbi:MAG: RND transporter [Sphingomonas sp. 28-66-16]|nr:MAG: RND transporter [Sphingomonas sp. 28-66-16]
MLLLGACTVGPDYRRPATSIAPVWQEPSGPGTIANDWWTGFGDPQLTALIEAGIKGNPGLREAEARLAEARANRDVARGGAGPKLNATASGTENQLSGNGQIPVSRIPGFSRNFSLFDAGFDASWEIDLWGGTRRSIEAAGARVEAAEAARAGTLVQLRAEIARTYFELRAAQARLAAARDDSGAQARTVDLVDRRFRGGEAARFDLARAQAQASATAATVPVLEGDVRAAAYTLARLVGQPPEAIAPALLDPKPLPPPPTSIAAGLRADLLRRRPDITRAERELAAATADIGVATADLFPRLSLLGSVGQEARSVDGLFTGGVTRFQLGPSFRWPILQRGTIRAKIRASDARADAAAARYEAAVFDALADSETALNRFARSAETERETSNSLAAARTALALADQRYRAGEDDLLPKLTAQSNAAEAERRLTDAQLARATAAVAVFKALGL